MKLTSSINDEIVFLLHSDDGQRRGAERALAPSTPCPVHSLPLWNTQANAYSTKNVVFVRTHNNINNNNDDNNNNNNNNNKIVKSK